MDSAEFHAAVSQFEFSGGVAWAALPAFVIQRDEQRRYIISLDKYLQQR